MRLRIRTSLALVTCCAGETTSGATVAPLANCQPEQLLVNTPKFSLYRAALQPIVVAAQQKMDRDDNAVHYLLGWSLFGFYYGFLVLIPVTLVAAVAGSAVHGEAISSILLTILAILAQAIGLQGGYMMGLTGRDVLSQFVARHAEPGTSSFQATAGLFSPGN